MNVQRSWQFIGVFVLVMLMSEHFDPLVGQYTNIAWTLLWIFGGLFAEFLHRNIFNRPLFLFTNWRPGL